MKIFLAVILLIVLLMFSATFFASYENKKLIESCNDLGYEELIITQGEIFCVDSEGYSHKVVKTRSRFELVELKFREEVLR